MKKIIVAESIMHVLDRNDKIVGQDADEELERGDRLTWTISVGSREIVAKSVVMQLSKPSPGELRFGVKSQISTPDLLSSLRNLSRDASSIDTGNHAPSFVIPATVAIQSLEFPAAAGITAKKRSLMPRFPQPVAKKFSTIFNVLEASVGRTVRFQES